MNKPLVSLLLVATAISLVVCVELAEAQSSLLWDRDYGMRGSGMCVINTQDGGYAIGGTSQNQFMLTKTNAQGEMQWQKNYGEGTANSLVQTSDGGYALAGTGSTFNFLKADSSGNLQWRKNYNNSGVSFLVRSVIQTLDGGYAMAGWTPVGNSPAWDWTIRTDSAGNIVWNKTYGVQQAQSQATCILREKNGYVLAANGNLYRLSENGEVQWTKQAVVANALVKTFDGGYLVAAGNGATLIKTDSEGNTQWSKAFRYQGAQWSFFHSAVQARDGGYVMSGTAYPVYNGLAWILKVDFNGTTVGEIAISPESGINNGAFSIVEASDGGFVFAGTKNAPDGEGNLWLAKARAEAIPEIPSWLALPLFFFAISLTTTAFWKKRKRLPQECREVLS